ncbi:hypothetical protein [Bergeyella sp. RCAD1439]|uniref:hypothetical protein n=1 Tax=Bergeyella anatis TaxID=3113737 RepID=UPI002E16EF83|nr:hypothetical protein [Bergeyella sp. RCAD1439]
METAGNKDYYFSIPYNINQSKTMDLGFKYIDLQRLAVGYSMEVNAGWKIAGGGEFAGTISIVNYMNKDYGGYLYHYVGGEARATMGLQAGVGASIGANFFIMYNTANKPNYDPVNFSGFGFSQDLKDVVGGGWNASVFSSGDWKGVSVGASLGVGLSGNLGSVYIGGSNSILLNNVIKTKDRTLMDKALNLFPSTSIPQATTQYTIDRIKKNQGKKDE